MVYSAWKLFGTLVSELLRTRPQSQQEKELNLMLDCTVLNRPTILAEGFSVIRAENSKEKTCVVICSLRDLEVGKAYITQKDTCVLRCSEDVVQLGEYFTSAPAGKITIPVPKVGDDNSEQNEKPSMKGELLTDIFILTLEKFTGRRVGAGALFYEKDMRMGRMVTSLGDLAMGKAYVSHDNYVQLTRLPNDRIRFRFSTKKDILPPDVHQPTVECFSPDFLDQISTTPRNGKSKGLLPYTATGQSPARTPLRSSTRKRLRDPCAAKPKGESPAKRRRDGLERAPGTKDLMSFSPVPAPMEGVEETASEATRTPPCGAPPCGAPPPPPPPPGGRPPPPPPAFGKAPDTPQKRLRPLRWSTIPAHKIKSTIWGKVQAGSLATAAGLEEEIESLFSLSPVKADKATIKMGNRTIKRIVHILPVKRTNNISIVLSRIPGTAEEIRSSLLLEEGSAELSLDQLLALKTLLPVTREEGALVRKHASTPGSRDLSKAELFVKVMAEMDRSLEKVSALIFAQQFLEIYEETIACVRTIFAACGEVQESERLPRLLEIILSLGSVLNRNTYLSSHGFRIESLLTLAETKARAGSVTFLDYLGKVVKQSAPDLIHFLDELPHCEAASEVSMDKVLVNCKTIKEEFSNAMAEMAKLEAEQKCDLPFYRRLCPFYQSNAANATSLANEVKTMQEKFGQVCTYFGEEEGSRHLSTSTFFSILKQFSAALLSGRSAKAEKVITELKASKEQIAPQSAGAVEAQG